MPHIMEPNASLIAQIKRDLLGRTQADVALGQFFLPELNTIVEEWKTLKRVRLLVGSNGERLDSAELLMRQARLSPAKQAMEAERYAALPEMRQRTARIAETMRRTLGGMMQSEADARLIASLLQLLDSGILDVRGFVEGRLESNLLLARDMRGKGTTILGGGNLLIPELNGGMSFTLRFDENEEQSAFQETFEGHWATGQNFKEPFGRVLRQSWAAQPTTPYLLYLLVLYRLVAERLQGDSAEPTTEWLEGFPPLADFQEVAVHQALSILRQHNGVFVADVVGLGKTYIGAAMLKRLLLEGQRATIFCPPSLVPMWQEFNDVYGLSAVVVSTGKLLRENGINLDAAEFQTTDRQIVLIDESHRFRNRDMERYRLLNRYTQGRRCILLTATPYSLRPADVYSQIRLFADDDLDLNLNPPRLNEYFRRIGEQQASLVDVLRHLLIRRTRKHIQKHYPDACIAVRQPDGTSLRKPLTFPKREKPSIVQYDVEGVYGGGLYDLIITKLGQPLARQTAGLPPEFRAGEMTYARYGLHNYVRSEFVRQEPYVNLQRTGHTVRGFIRVLLFKRLESSIEAFRRTTRKMLEVHERFLLAIENGHIPAGDLAQGLLYEQEWESDNSLLEALSQLDGRYNIEAFDQERLQRDIRNDRDVLQELVGLLEPITPQADAKLQTLRDLLQTELQNKKVLIFTQYEATAEYLYNHLSDLPQTAWLSGRHRSAGQSFMATIARFAPRANPRFVRPDAEPILRLIATDVLSEGLNLQDCSIVINYDLHWNPVRLIQRIGRVDRIGSEAESIRLFNFLPERNVEKILKIEEVLRQRIMEIHRFIGEDNAILHPDEQINDAELYNAYLQPVEEEGDNAATLAVDYTEIEERMRQIQRGQPELFQAMLNLPAGVRTARRVATGTHTGTFVMLDADGYEKLILLDAQGHETEARLEQMLACLECSDAEPSCTLPPRHNAHVSAAVQRFEENASQRKTDRMTGPQLTAGQRYALKHLHISLKDEMSEDRRHTLSNIEKALRTRIPEAALKELNTVRRLGLIGNALEQRLLQAYRDLDLGRYIRQTEEISLAPMAHIVCSEAFLPAESSKV